MRKKYFCVEMTPGNSTMNLGERVCRLLMPRCRQEENTRGKPGPCSDGVQRQASSRRRGLSASAPRGRGQHLRRARAGGGSAAGAGKGAPGKRRPPSGTSKRTSRIVRCLPSGLVFVAVVVFLFLFFSY